MGISQPLEPVSTGQADDVFYCKRQKDADLFTSTGGRIPLKPGDPRCSEWCDIYEAVLDHNEGRSPTFPDCGNGHPHHPLPCQHCTQPNPKPKPPPQPKPPQPAPVTPVAPCPHDHHIVSVEWLDGSDTKTTAAANHFVNMPRNAKWVTAPEIPNIDRLGMNPRFKVTFDKPVSASFKYKLIPVTGGTTAYTATETGRNGRFKHTDTEKSGTTGGDGTVILNDLALVAGGGYKFKIEATDEHGKKVTSGTLTTKRLFWYVEARMSGLTSVVSTTTPVETEYAKHHMIIKKLPNLTIPRQQNIGSSADSSTMWSNVTTAVNASATTKAKAPYLLTTAFTDHLAVKNTPITLSKTSVTVGPGQAAVTIPVMARGLRSPNAMGSKQLWRNIISGESWFISALYNPDNSWTSPSTYFDTTIPASKVSLAGSGRSVSVDVSWLGASTGTIEVVVSVVDRMRAGLASTSASNTCVCTRAWWQNQSDAEQQGVMIHEYGHKVQMVAAGTGIEPDKCPNHYLDKGHVGDHCHKGCPAGQANYATSAMNSASTCVMFGSTNNKLAFCADCAPAVKKVDLNAGW